MTICRVPGCVALATTEDTSGRARSVCPIGICATHLTLPDDDLKALLKRGCGVLAPLRHIASRIEYERADGSQYGYDDEGRYYDVPRKI